MKKWMSLSIISLLLIIIAIGILLPKGMVGKIQGRLIEEKYPDETPTSYEIIQENSINQNLSQYIFLNYTCEDYNNQIRCNGEVKYTGPEEYITPDMYVRLYCYNENKFEGTNKTEDCTLDNDYLYLGKMNSNKNKVEYQLKCFYGEDKTFKVKIGISDGVVVYPYRC